MAECAGEQKAQHRSRGNSFSAFIPAPLPRAAILVWSIAPELLTTAFLGYIHPVLSRGLQTQLSAPLIAKYQRFSRDHRTQESFFLYLKQSWCRCLREAAFYVSSEQAVTYVGV